MPVEMGPNFSPVIAFYGNQVYAMGPLGWDDDGNPDYVEELRAWIYQPLEYSEDAAAADTSTAEGTQSLAQEPGKCWLLPLTRLTQANFERNRRAFAVAVAHFSNDESPPESPRGAGLKKGRTMWWGHPVELQESLEAMNVAETYKANPGAAWDRLTALLTPVPREPR
jgi:hypothetical protein